MSYRFDDEVIARLFKEVCTKIQKNQLKEVNFSGTMLTSDQIKILCEILSKNKTVTSLIITKLDLIEKNGLETGGIKYISELLLKNKTITSLTLSNNNLTDENIQSLASALFKNDTLTELNLQSNKIREGISYLAEMLLKNRTIQTLRLDNNLLGFNPKTSKVVSELLSNNKTLTRLYLGSNNFFNKDVELFCDALQKNRSLTFLDLSENPLVNSRVLKHVEELFSKNDTLINFNLISNQTGQITKNPITTLAQSTINQAQTKKKQRIFIYFLLDWFSKRKVRSNEILEKVLSFLGYEFDSIQNTINFYNEMHGEEYNSNDSVVNIVKHCKGTHFSFANRGFNNSRMIRLAKELSEIETIESINLNKNEFGLIGLCALMGTLENKKMKSLELANNKLSSFHLPPKQPASFPFSLVALNLEGNRLKPEIVTWLVRGLFPLLWLEELNLRDNNVGDANFGFLGTVIAQNENLKFLNLRNCNLSSNSNFFKCIKDILVFNKRLRTLSLAENNFDADQINQVVYALAKNNSLTSIYLQGNTMHFNVEVFKNMIFENTSLLYIQYPAPDIATFVAMGLKKTEIEKRMVLEEYNRNRERDILIRRREKELLLIKLFRKNKITGLLLKHLLEYAAIDVDRFNDVMNKFDSIFVKIENEKRQTHSLKKQKQNCLLLKKQREEAAMLHEIEAIRKAREIEGDLSREEIFEAFDRLEGKRTASLKKGKTTNKNDKCLVQ